MPHPLILHFKEQVKAKVLDYWNERLRGNAYFLSAPFIHPSRMSLVSPHKLLSSAGSNPYKVAKARVQLQFLCSAYRSAKLCRHWILLIPMSSAPFHPAGIDLKLNQLNIFCHFAQLTRQPD